MRTIPAEPPPFFRRGPSPLARVTFFGLASIVLLFADARFRYLEELRHAAGVIVFPLQRLVRVPGEALDSVASYFASKRNLERENERLRTELISQSPAAQGYAPALDENARLKALIDLKSRHAEGSTVVRVLYTGRDPFAQKVFVNRGSESGLVPGSESGRLEATTYAELLETDPRRAVEKAVKGMLPHNKLGRQVIKKLKVYSGPSHPHAAQQPQPYEISQVAQ